MHVEIFFARSLKDSVRVPEGGGPSMIHPEFSVRREKTVSCFGDTKHKPINGLSVRRRQARRDATRRPVSRKPQTNRKLSCLTIGRWTRRKTRKLPFEWKCGTQIDCARRKRQTDARWNLSNLEERK